MVALLSGGDLRSLGRAGEAGALVAREPGHLAEVVECLWAEDAVVRMRAADALEKIGRPDASALAPHKAQLLGLLDEAEQQEVRWHLALIVPRLQLTSAECMRVAERLQAYLGDRSAIVKTDAMQGLADLSEQHARLRTLVLDLLRTLTRTGTPAMRARGRILLGRLEPA